jgi:integrase
VVLRAIDVSPAESVPSPRYKAKERPTLDHDQTKKLLDVRERHRWEAFNKLARLHGMRLGEIAALPWKDVDLKSRVV